MTNETIMDTITCPITQEPMRDPVMGSDGQTYEKSAIVDWLSNNNTSPLDRSTMSVKSLLPNVAIRFLCDKYHNGELGESVPMGKSINELPVPFGIPVDEPEAESEAESDEESDEESDAEDEELRAHIHMNIYKSPRTNPKYQNIRLVTADVRFPDEKEHFSQDIMIVIDRSHYMAEITNIAVSYTHLTLPTIYSV